MTLRFMVACFVLLGCGGSDTSPLDAVVSPRPLVLAIGQSNNTGHGMLADVDALWAVPSPTVTLYAHLGQNSPPTFVDYTGPLQARADGEFGLELSLGVDIPDRDIIKCGVGGTSLYRDWNPVGEWPTPDKNLYTLCLRFAHEVETATGGQITAITWSQGEADATAEGPSLAYGDNLHVFAGLLLTEFPCAWFHYYRLPKRLVYSANVRAGQERDASDPWMAMVDVDALPTIGVHFTSEGYLMLGNTYAASINAVGARCSQ